MTLTWTLAPSLPNSNSAFQWPGAVASPCRRIGFYCAVRKTLEIGLLSSIPLRETSKLLIFLSRSPAFQESTTITRWCCWVPSRSSSLTTQLPSFPLIYRRTPTLLSSGSRRRCMIATWTWPEEARSLSRIATGSSCTLWMMAKNCRKVARSCSRIRKSRLFSARKRRELHLSRIVTNISSCRSSGWRSRRERRRSDLLYQWSVTLKSSYFCKSIRFVTDSCSSFFSRLVNWFRWLIR